MPLTQGFSHYLAIVTTTNFILGVNHRSNLVGTILPFTATICFIYVEGLVRDTLMLTDINTTRKRLYEIAVKEMGQVLLHFDYPLEVSRQQLQIPKHLKE